MGAESTRVLHYFTELKHLSLVDEVQTISKPGNNARDKKARCTGRRQGGRSQLFAGTPGQVGFLLRKDLEQIFQIFLPACIAEEWLQAENLLYSAQCGSVSIVLCIGKAVAFGKG